MKKVIIDRFEEGTAVCLDMDDNQVLIEASLLPEGSDEGCTLIIEDNGSIYFDKKDTAERAERISRLEDELFE